MQSVDLTEPLEAIKLKHGDRWYLAEDAVHDAEALWQGKANRHGVFMGYETITLAKVGSCNAEARIIQTGKGWWAASSSYDYGYGGAGSAPSVWERQAFLNREDALAAIAEEIARSFATIAQERNGNPPTDEHKGLKDFMLQQIKISYPVTTYESEFRYTTPEEWRDAKIKLIQESIEYYTKSYEEEVKRVKGRSEWVKQLRDSLK